MGCGTVDFCIGGMVGRCAMKHMFKKARTDFLMSRFLRVSCMDVGGIYIMTARCLAKKKK